MSGSDATSQTLSTDITSLGGDERASGQKCLQLVLLWSAHEPARVGEVCVVSRTATLGRGTSVADHDPPKLEFMRQRPGANQHSGSLEAPTLSRRQWRLEPKGAELSVENLGKRALLHNGLATQSCQAAVGDTLGVEGVVSFLVAKRPRLLRAVAYEDFEFGASDANGIVGETPEVWELRHDVSLLGRGQSHVVIFGPSGSGKDLCARGVWRASARASAELVSRNAASIPSGLVEAELFGNAANYPHAGIAARSGLIGMAHKGTLFLDEVGELPEHQQANLLRVMDTGEYQRLGEDRLQKSSLRVLAATNRAPDALKSDFLARFTERLSVPGLNERRADVPLLARQLLARICAENPEDGPSRLGMALAEALTRHQYRLHHRELERLLRLARRHSSPHELQLCPEVEAELDLPIVSSDTSADAVRRALAGSKSAAEAAKRLGLPSRFALYRLMKRLGIEAEPGRKATRGDNER